MFDCSKLSNDIQLQGFHSTLKGNTDCISIYCWLVTYIVKISLLGFSDAGNSNMKIKKKIRSIFFLKSFKSGLDFLEGSGQFFQMALVTFKSTGLVWNFAHLCKPTFFSHFGRKINKKLKWRPAALWLVDFPNIPIETFLGETGYAKIFSGRKLSH